MLAKILGVVDFAGLMLLAYLLPYMDLLLTMMWLFALFAYLFTMMIWLLSYMEQEG